MILKGIATLRLTVETLLANRLRRKGLAESLFKFQA